MVDGKKIDPVGDNIFLASVHALGLDITCFVIGGPRPGDSFRVGDEVFLVEAQVTVIIKINQCLIYTINA
ncbi:hypothetical protein ACUOFC_42500, partial [Escherichia sp. TWPC-MK]